MSTGRLTGSNRWIATICVVGGGLLAIIGVRYLFSPVGAARSFGVPGRPLGFELHYAVGLRDIWLGLLAIACVLMRQWRAVALWFAMGTVVCFADATIAASSTGRLPQIAFHVICGIACACLALATWRIARTET
jgi:hypothetical protein